METRQRRPTGRPRGFDADEALERAMLVFWEQGYEGASLAGLTGAMGISTTSMYAAFGNKEELFRKALERYTEGPSAYLDQALEEPTALGVATAILAGTVRTTTRPARPHGCLGVQGALAAGDSRPWSPRPPRRLARQRLLPRPRAVPAGRRRRRPAAGGRPGAARPLRHRLGLRHRRAGRERRRPRRTPGHGRRRPAQLAALLRAARRSSSRTTVSLYALAWRQEHRVPLTESPLPRLDRVPGRSLRQRLPRSVTLPDVHEPSRPVPHDG